MQYIRETFWSANDGTLLNAVQRGFLFSWPEVTPELLRKNLSKSKATEKGHLKMQHKNLRSSQRIQGKNLPLRTSLDIAPEQEANNATTGDIYAFIYKAYTLIKQASFLIYLQESINTSLSIMITTEMPSWLKHCLIAQLEPLLKHGIHVLLK